MKTFLQTLFLSCILHVSIAQSQSYTKLRDFYPMLSNVDSLEKVVYSYKNEPLRYLQGLIRLEYCRRINSDKFGQDFETIRVLSEKLNYPLGMAVYNLNQAKAYRRTDLAKSFLYTQDALNYFEKTKDTTGIITGLFQLIMLNIDEFERKRGDIKLAKQRFDRMVELGESSSFINDVVTVRLRSQRFRNNFYKLYSYDEHMAFFKELEALIQKVNPLERRAYLELLYQDKGGFFGENDKPNEALAYYIKSLEYCDYCSPGILAITYTNIADTYEQLGRHEDAKSYYKKNIDFAKLYPDKISPLLINSFNSYSEVLFKNGEFKEAWAYRNTKDSLENAYNEKSKAKVFFDLQAKYETEKKESTIKTLKLEKKTTALQKKVLVIGLLLAVLVVGVVGFLLLKLRKSNTDLLMLQKARDKLYTIIAHDLRSPLNTYQRYSEIVGYLVKTKQFDRLNTTLKQIDEIGLHLASLLNNLLAWSLSQQKQVNFTPKAVQVKEFFNELLPIYRDMANLKSVALIEDFNDDEIKTDPDTLSLIVRNLLDNAIKYTSEGEQVAIKSYSNDAEFVFSLTNKGDTMTEAQKVKIKALFETKQNFDFGEGGLGVGLILVKQYSKTNQAKITFDNDNDGRTTFRVVLPRLAS